MPTTDLAHQTRPPRFPRASRPLRRLATLTAAAASAALLVAGVTSPASAAPGDPGLSDLALAGTATASRYQNNQDGAFPAALAIDGKGVDEPVEANRTRWASGTDDDTSATGTGGPVTYEVDLGTTADLDSLKLEWEASGAKSYTVGVSTDGSTWTTAATVTDGAAAETRVLDLAGAHARYVLLTMTEQIANNWDPSVPHYYGYSLYSVEVWGEADQTLVGFAAATSTVEAGATATVPVRLNQPAATDQTVHVTSTDGTAHAGDDYTAIDADVTIPAGSTTATVTSAIPSGADGGDFTLTLSAPSSGIVLGSRTTHTVTVSSRPVPLPPVGAWVDYLDMEGSALPGYTWGADAGNTPSLTLVPSDRTDTPASSQAVKAQMTDGTNWGGFSNDPNPHLSWKSYDAFRFWFKGNANGKTLAYQLKSDGITFETTFVDDSTDWKAVEVAFDDLHTTDPSQRFNPKNVTGWSIVLNGYGNQPVYIDDMELRELAGDVESFDDNPTLTDEAHPVGIYSWGGDSTSYPTVGLTTDDRDGAAASDNTVLSGTYHIADGSWGGVTQNFATSQDWRLYKGIRFWWYSSMENNPASPTAGNDIKFEIRTGYGSGTQAALYQASFKDNWGKDAAGNPSRWKLVELPFSSFQRRTDYQQDWTTTDTSPILSTAWGWSLTFVASTPETGWKVDSLETYGAATSADDVVLSADPSVSLVDAGDDATVTVSAVSGDGEPFAQDVEVAYTTTDGTAVAGTDYTTTSGTLTFPSGTESGATQTFTVPTTATTTASVAKQIGITLTSTSGSVDGAGKIVINAHGLPYLDASRSNEARAADLLSRMTTEEKVGQMAQAERLGLSSTDDIATLGLGSVLSGGGSVPADNTPSGWADMVDGYQRVALSTRLQIPIVYGVDAVHGHNNVVGATLFPHNVGLGATHDPAIVEAAGQVTAQEVRATGIPWTFSPCLCVSRDERWGRSYESFGEDPALVSTFASAAITGLQGSDPSDISGSGKVLATAKHWVGDGGTTYGTGAGGYPIDQGVTNVASLDELKQLYVEPYEPAIAAGVGSIMPSYSGVSINGGPVVRMHENTDLNTTLLKDELGFKGFLISDWEGIDKLPGGTYAQKAVRSVNSGMDMAMAPYNYASFIQAIEAALVSGDVTQARVDDAVTRILVQKFALGLFEQPLADRAHTGDVGSAANRAVARKAVAESQVLLKNDGALPLSTSEKVYVAGSSSNDIGRQSGGWSISWQGSAGAITQGTTIGQGIQAAGGTDNVTLGTGTAAPTGHYDVGVVVVGEKPYAEGVGDVGNTSSPDVSMALSTADRTTITNVCTASNVDRCVVLVVSGRPQYVTDQLSQADALVASWLPGTEGEGVADVLYGDVPFTGRLSVTWPTSSSPLPINVGDATYAPEFAYGWGLRTDSARARLQALDATLGASAARTTLRRVLAADVWASDGSVSDATAALPLLQKAAAQLRGTDRVVDADVVVSVARDVAQAAVVAGTASTSNAKQTSDAEHELFSGEPGTAVRLLAAAANVTLPTSGDLPETLSSIASLSGITVNGVALPGFSATTTSYKVTVAKGSSVPVVVATTTDAEAEATVTPATAVPGTTTIKVTAADGTTTKTYTVSFVANGTAAKTFSKVGKVAVTATGGVKASGKRLGQTLHARASGAQPAATSVTYQWTRGGKKVAGATKATYRLTAKDLGKKVGVVVTLHRTDYKDATVSSTVYTIKKAAAKVTLKTKAVKVKGKKRVRATVKVTSAVKVTGKVKVTWTKGKKTRSVVAKVKKGKVTVTLPRLAKGTYKVKAGYKGSKTVASKTSKVAKVRQR